MKRIEIMEGCPDDWKDSLKGKIDTLEAELCHVCNMLEACDPKDSASVIEATNLLAEICNELH